MIRRATTIGVLAAALALTTAFTAPEYSRLLASARNFETCFRDLGRTEQALSPVERVMLSLMLAGTPVGAKAETGS
jgi:hypothetical protein